MGVNPQDMIGKTLMIRKNGLDQLVLVKGVKENDKGGWDMDVEILNVCESPVGLDSEEK